MPRRTDWRKLIPGVVILAVLAAGVVVVLLYARIGALRGETAVFYALAGEARGVMPGTEVWIAGQKVGKVDAIEFRPPSTDTTQRLVIAMEVYADALPLIRENSTIEIRPGGTLIGAQVVHVSPGTPAVPPITPGDTLRTEPQLDVENVTSRLARASEDVPRIVENVRMIAEQARALRASFGALDPETPAATATFRARAGRLARVAADSDGTLGLLLREGDPLEPLIRSVLLSVDSLQIVLGSERTSLGRFRRDSTLLRSVEALHAEVADVRLRLEESRGTAGRVLRDEALVRQLASVQEELAAVIEDIKRRPLRYLHF